MKFNYNIIKNEYMEGELLYLLKEQSLCYSPFDSNVGFSIMCGYYTSLDMVCETCRITQISGYNPKEKWILTKLDIPSSEPGELFAILDFEPQKGTGCYYSYCSTYFDMQKSYICIGSPVILSSDVCIEFAHNLIAVLRDKELISIFGKIKEN